MLTFRLNRAFATLIVVLSLTLSMSHRAASQSSRETGKPFFTCFSMQDYHGGSQNWQMVQDNRGVMFIGNNFGVIEYDGASWRMIRTPARNVIRSFGVDENGRIYVGAFAEFGYLAPDAVGSTAFVSLQQLLGVSEAQFADVWTTYATPEGIYFQARERLIRLTPKVPDVGPDPSQWTVDTWEPDDRFMWSFWVDGSLYVHESGAGVYQMVDDELVLLPGSEIFADDRMQVMLSLGDGRYLFDGFTSGPFVYDGSTFSPWNRATSETLKEAIVYKGVILGDSSVALATLQDGVYVLDFAGNIQMHMSVAEGLRSSTITSISVDRRGTLWVSPENGLCQIETPSPLSRFDANDGIGGNLSSIVRFEDRLYVATTTGLYYFADDARRFESLAGMAPGNPQAWDLLPIGSNLLAATATGVYEVRGTRLQNIRQSIAGAYEAQTLHQSKQDPNRVFVALSNGLGSLYHNRDGSWTDEGLVPGVTDYITQIEEPEAGVIWLGIVTGGTARIKFDNPSSQPTRIDRYGKDDGLATDGGTSVFIAAGHVIHAQNEGVFRFDEQTGRFEPDPLLGNVVSVGGSQEEFSVAEDRQGNIWTNFGGETAVLRRKSDGTYETDKTALLRFADAPAITIYPEDNGVVWFGGNEILIRYDQNVVKDYAADFPALIRRVTVGEDSVIYGGSGLSADSRLILQSGHDALRIEYASPSFENPKENRYQVMLEGFDERWSSWTPDVRRDYTNLPAGEYVFRVRARNTYEQE
ncbi:MAG: triple tyrosine motif-containing protein, partial [Candidatus Latescibacterota bacterium]